MARHDDSDWTVAQPDDYLTRRRALGLVGGVIGAAGGGAALVSTGSDAARAAVSVDSWNVADASFEASQVTAVADATLAYEYGGGDTVTATRAELLVDETVVAHQESMTALGTDSGTVELAGRLTDSDAWSSSDFEASVGETVEREVTVGARFAVLGDGQKLAADTASETATVTVSNPANGDLTVSMGGEVTIRTATDG